jgi:hypothetical protein
MEAAVTMVEPPIAKFRIMFIDSMKQKFEKFSRAYFPYGVNARRFYRALRIN